MKILFFSDIHGVSNNLKLLKDLDKEEQFDKIVCLGDMFYHYGREVKDLDSIVEFLNSFDDRIIGILGNCDSYSDVKKCKFKIYDDFYNIKCDGLNIYMTHGHLYNKDTSFFDGDVLIYGHEHYPYIEKSSDRVYINTGSIALPRYNSKESFLIYSNRNFTLYDIDKNIIKTISL